MVCFDCLFTGTDRVTVCLTVGVQERIQCRFASTLGLYFDRKLSWWKHIKLTTNTSTSNYEQCLGSWVDAPNFPSQTIPFATNVSSSPCGHTEFSCGDVRSPFTRKSFNASSPNPTLPCRRSLVCLQPPTAYRLRYTILRSGDVQIFPSLPPPPDQPSQTTRRCPI